MFFDAEYQRELLVKTTSTRWMSEAGRHLQAEMFLPELEPAAKEALQRFRKSGRAWSPGQLKQACKRLEVKLPKGEDLDDYDFDRTEILRFARSRLLRQALSDAHLLEEQGKHEKAVESVLEARRRFPNEREEQEDLPTNLFERKGVPPHRKNLVGLGLEGLNQALNGGVGAGELCTFLAESSRGKTAFLCWVAAHAATRGVRVLYVTLEDPKANIELRMQRLLTGKASVSPREWITTARKLSRKGGQMNVLEMLPLSFTVEDLGRKVPEKTQLLVVDYADYVLAPSRDVGLDHQNLGVIYLGLRNIGVERGIPVLTASQVNREGYGVENKGFIHGEGALKKGMIARQVISLNFLERTSWKKEKQDPLTATRKRPVVPPSSVEEGFLWVDKNAYGPRKIRVPFQVDWSLGQFKETR